MIRPPILIDFPETIETPRLLLQIPKPGDSDIVQPSVELSFPELSPWMPWAKKLQTKEETEAVLRQFRSKFFARESFEYIFIEKSSGLHVGTGGLHNIDWEVPSFELGYWCSTPMTGKGLIAEAVKVLTTLCFQKLEAKRISIVIDERNIKSCKVAERAGYRYEGTYKNSGRDTAGNLSSKKVYAMYDLIS